MHCACSRLVFKLTHPSSLPGRKRHTQLGIVWKGACHLASLRLSHTHMHTLQGQSGIAPNNGRPGFAFPWQSVGYQQSSHGGSGTECCKAPCVCVCICVCLSYMQRYLAQKFRQSLGWFLSWPPQSLPSFLQTLTFMQVRFQNVWKKLGLLALISLSRCQWQKVATDPLHACYYWSIHLLCRHMIKNRLHIGQNPLFHYPAIITPYLYMTKYQS